jgi:hypothetical protein
MSDTSYKNTIALAIDIERGAIRIYTPFGDIENDKIYWWLWSGR